MSAVPAVWTVRALLDWTTRHFQAKGIDSPNLDARLLLANVLNCKPIEVLMRSDDEPTAAERAKYREFIQKRIDGCPVAYLIGTRDFYLLSFDVTPAVLIPRPDTETLVEVALEALNGKSNPSIIDLGTGSGCLAVSLAHQRKDATVLAVDVSPDAAELARKNATKHGVSDRVSVAVGNLFGPVPVESRFDLIVSNPPYIPPSEIETLDVGVKDYEPRLALDGGPDGLTFYRRIASEAAAFLKPGGRLAVEIGWTQEPAVRELFESSGAWDVGPSRKDYGGRWRVVQATKRG